MKTPSPFLTQVFPAAVHDTMHKSAGLGNFLAWRNYISKTASADYNWVKKTNNKGRLPGEAHLL